MIDLGPPPSLYLPARPSIIRAHQGDLDALKRLERERGIKAMLPGMAPTVVAAASGPPPFGVIGTPLATVQTSSSTNRNINIPTGVLLNELLLAILTTSNGSAVTLSPPSGWTAVSGAASSNTNTNQNAFWKIAAGTEGGTTVQSVDSALVSNSVAVCYRITGHDPATAPVATNTNSASTSTPDPPNLAPGWGSVLTLYIAAFGRRSTACSMDAYPSGYVDHPIGNDASNCKTYAITRKLTGTSENPGAFSLSSAAQANALTIAVKAA